MLLTFLKLRKESIDRAGYVQDSVLEELTFNQRYRMIPKMRKLGWIDSKNKLTSTNKIVQNYYPDEHLNNVHVQVDYLFIKNKKNLKDFIFAIVEQYILTGKYRAENHGFINIDRDTLKLTRQHVSKASGRENFKTSKSKITKSDRDLSINELSEAYLGKSENVLTSRISRSMLNEWGYSNSTITRRRKACLNKYKKKEFIPSDEEGKSFFNRSIKKHIKILPTQVTSPSSSIFYFNYSKLNKSEALVKSKYRCEKLFNEFKSIKRFKLSQCTANNFANLRRT